MTQAVRERVLSKIHWLAENFEQVNPQPLTSDLSGFFKLELAITE
ncbi:type II toxin-antitoxin system RelE/ParE family toxin [Tolypothrix campylonemoides VB511288_2]|uniref:Type II toxin-antitoxin system RelE/ParE family toxin n=2 Tax=Nostocales TaxID=1161 RepID=A0ABW8WUE3_9CYAN|nr:hypothetical protein [Tolypothrix bouteillei]